jgi:hypothetical protein
LAFGEADKLTICAYPDFVNLQTWPVTTIPLCVRSSSESKVAAPFLPMSKVAAPFLLPSYDESQVASPFLFRSCFWCFKSVLNLLNLCLNREMRTTTNLHLQRVNENLRRNENNHWHFIFQTSSLKYKGLAFGEAGKLKFRLKIRDTVRQLKIRDTKEISKFRVYL